VEKATVSAHTSVEFIETSCRWVLSHHGMVRPQVEDGGEGLQIWR